MPRLLALASLSLALVATTTLPADARPAAGQDRPPSRTIVKKAKIDKTKSNRIAAGRPASHWSSTAPDVDRVGSLPAPSRVGAPVLVAPALGGLPAISFPGSRSFERCDIVVKRPGGNPTQDMTGSIGHAKSHQSNGGAGRMRVCGAR